MGGLQGVVLKLRHLHFDIVSTVRCPVEDFDIRISSFYDLSSTPVENVRQIRLFLQNEPNFPRFSTENKDLTEKRTQTNPIQNQFFTPKIRIVIYIEKGFNKMYHVTRKIGKLLMTFYIKYFDFRIISGGKK